MSDYLSAKEIAAKWNINPNRVTVLCSEGRIEGAVKNGMRWLIPSDAEKPADARIKFGKYMKNHQDECS